MRLFLSWRATTRYLNRAYSLISKPDIVSDESKKAELEYVEYLHYNELELALDSLEALAAELQVPAAFWKNMKSAAKSMELKSHLERYTQQLQQSSS